MKEVLVILVLILMVCFILFKILEIVWSLVQMSFSAITGMFSKELDGWEKASNLKGHIYGMIDDYWFVASLRSVNGFSPKCIMEIDFFYLDSEEPGCVTHKLEYLFFTPNRQRLLEVLNSVRLKLKKEEKILIKDYSDVRKIDQLRREMISNGTLTDKMAG